MNALQNVETDAAAPSAVLSQYSSPKPPPTPPTILLAGRNSAKETRDGLNPASDMYEVYEVSCTEIMKNKMLCRCQTVSFRASEGTVRPPAFSLVMKGQFCLASRAVPCFHKLLSSFLYAHSFLPGFHVFRMSWRCSFVRILEVSKYKFPNVSALSAEGFLWHFKENHCPMLFLLSQALLPGRVISNTSTA